MIPEQWMLEVNAGDTLRVKPGMRREAGHEATVLRVEVRRGCQSGIMYEVKCRYGLEQLDAAWFYAPGTA